MKYDSATFKSGTKGESTITLRFTDTDPRMPQMDNMVTRSVIFTFQEWAELVFDVEKISGIQEMIAVLEGKQGKQMCRCVYPDKCFCPESAKAEEG